MDAKTTLALILVGMGFSFLVVSKLSGIDGDVYNGMLLLISTGIFILTGKDIFNKSKEK